MKRRRFLQSASGIALPVMVNGLAVSGVQRSNLFDYINPESDRVLVLLQCIGGYDGLNMLIPTDQYGKLQTVRSNILIPESQLIDLQPNLALHPRLQGLADLYQDGQAGFIQAVGYPNQNRSHFRSKDIWTSASRADEVISTGWLGRYLDDEHPTFPDGFPNESQRDPFAITMGSAVSETCQGATSNFSMSVNDPFNLAPLTVTEGSEAGDSYYGQQLSFLRDIIIKSNEYAEVIQAAAKKGQNKVSYPDFRLAQHLKNISILLSGGLTTKIFVVTLGGFDTHANQTGATDPLDGRHSPLLEEMAASLKAFQADLVKLGMEDRVLTMAFTEFGRRIKSNGSFGTDHGSAAPMFLVGSCVNAQIMGENVVIPNEVGDKEGVPMQFDFRSVYGSILQDWFEVPEDKIRQLIYAEYRHLPILQHCQATTSSEDLFYEYLDASVFPNPSDHHLQIAFTLPQSETVRIELFDLLGKMVDRISDQSWNAGQHRVSYACQHLVPGNYFIRFSGEKGRKNLLFQIAR